MLLVGVLVYNYFLGTPNERESSEKVFRQVKELGKSVADMLKEERAKFKEGKYDKALDQIGNLLQGLKGSDKVHDESDRQTLDQLMQKRETLEKDRDRLKRALDNEGSDEVLLQDSQTFEEELRQLESEARRLRDKISGRSGNN